MLSCENGDLARVYIAGLIASDGNVTCSKRSCKIKVVTNSREFSDIIRDKMSRIGYCGKVSIYEDLKRERLEIYCYSKEFAYILRTNFFIKSGKKSDVIMLPNIPRKPLTCFVRGLYDGDSSVIITRTRLIREDKEYYYILPRITYKTKSAPLAKQLLLFLTELGFSPYLWRYKSITAINLDGLKNIWLFLDRIGYDHPEKYKKLLSIVSGGSILNYYVVRLY